MKQIDKLVGFLARFQAEALTATSGAAVVVKVASGDRTSNQTLDHASVVAMVQEVAPAQCMNDLRTGRPARFTYDSSPQGAVTVEVTPVGQNVWRMFITPGAQPSLPRQGQGPANNFSLPSAPVLTTQNSAPARAAAPVAAQAQGVSPAQAQAQAQAQGETAAIDRMLRMMAQKGASDLHLSTGSPPMMRLHGEMDALEQAAPLTTDALRSILMPIAPQRNREEFARRNDTDFAYEIVGLCRFRVNMFMDRNGVGAVFRRIPFEIIPAEKLGISSEVMELCNLAKGLVLVTGPTGSGKSTTLAAMVDRINSSRDDHIITIEDPIEFVHNDKRCLVNQREVRVHTDGFRPALRAALREDPDIVLVGEMRDLETIEIAIETAETGHLVFGTLHTNTAPSTVDRIIDQFPADRQSQIRTMLADSLKGVIAQTLCKKIGGGRVAAYEVLIGTTAVSNLIREAKTFQLYGTMQSSRNVGMTTLGDSLLDLVLEGKIEPREGYLKAINKTEIKTLFANAGVVLPES